MIIEQQKRDEQMKEDIHSLGTMISACTSRDNLRKIKKKFEETFEKSAGLYPLQYIIGTEN